MRLKILKRMKKKRKTKNSRTLLWQFDKRDQMSKQIFWPLWKQSMEGERKKKEGQKCKRGLAKRSEKQQSKNENDCVVFLILKGR